MRIPVWLCLTFSAASALGQTPTCSDKRTLELVRRIFEQSIERQAAGFPQAQEFSRSIMSKIAVNVRSIRTATIERQIGKHYCAGVMEVRLSPKAAAMINAPHAQTLLAQSPETKGVRIVGNTVTHDVEFTSQLTDDRKEHFVEAGGFQVLAELAFQLVGQEAVEQLASTPSGSDARRSSIPSTERKPAAAGQDELSTRHGKLSTSTDNVLLFNGKPVKPEVQGNNSLSFVEKFQLGNTDVVLVQDNGGSACPAQYHFVTVAASGIRVSPSFGSCSDLAEVSRKGDQILVSMPGFVGPFESKAAQAKAARRKHVFVYANGVVTENGKPIK
jgi:hypothetical protein